MQFYNAKASRPANEIAARHRGACQRGGGANHWTTAGRTPARARDTRFVGCLMDTNEALNKLSQDAGVDARLVVLVDHVELLLGGAEGITSLLGTKHPVV